MVTFAQLGIPFPLYEGKVEDTNYVGLSSCSSCGKPREHSFLLGIGCAVVVPCLACQCENYLDAHYRADVQCRKCGTNVVFPCDADDDVRCCYSCLRQGSATITKDTELGMISWEQALDGVTHGRPGLIHPDFELVPMEDDWVGARLPHEVMFELLRTPKYSSWQGDCWLFCCKRPMVYLGNWVYEDFVRNAPDGDGKALFEKVVMDPMSQMWDQWNDSPSFYVFGCRHCGRRRSHWDMS